MVHAPYVILTVLLIGTLSALPTISYYHQAYAQTVIDTVTVGDIPRGVGVNPATNRIYVANQGDDTVSVVDGTTNEVIATVGVGNAPEGVAVNPTTNRIYVTNFNDGTVSVIDGTTNEVIATVGVGNSPSSVAVNPTTNRIYVGNTFAGTVSVIDGTTNEVIATVRVGGVLIGGIDVNPDTNRIYVGTITEVEETDRSAVSVIDGTTNQVIDTFDLGSGVVGSSDVAVAVNPSTNRIYVTTEILDGRGPGVISVIDGTTNEVIATIDDPEPDPQGVAVNPSTNRIYVTNTLDFGASAGVYVIDGTTNEVIATIGGFSAGGVAVNPDTNRIYVAHGDNEVSVIEDSPGDDVVLEADIDIKPDDDGVSTINTKSRGSTTVAILGSEEFGDVSQVDISSIEFAGASPSSTRPRLEDVNGDGIADLILMFNTQAMDELQVGDTEACLVGELNDGTLFEGCDEVRVI